MEHNTRDEEVMNYIYRERLCETRFRSVACEAYLRDELHITSELLETLESAVFSFPLLPQSWILESDNCQLSDSYCWMNTQPAMSYSDDIEMWNFENILESSPLSTLTADFGRFKERFARIFGSNSSIPFADSDSETTSVASTMSSANRRVSNTSATRKEGVGGSTQYRPQPAKRKLDPSRTKLRKSEHVNRHKENSIIGNQGEKTPRKFRAKRPTDLPVIPHVITKEYLEAMKTKGYSSAGPVVRSKDEIQVHPRLTQSYLEEYHNNYDVKLSQAATIHDWQFNKCEREVEDYVCRPKGNQPDVRFSVNYLQSPLDQQLTNCRASNGLLGAYLSPSHTFFKEQSQKGPSTPYPHKDRLGATHRGTHRFVPRHSDEMVVEIGDSIHVLDEAEDGWCMGINLTSQVQGLFPSVYATDLKFYEVNGSAEKQPSAKLYKLHFLGSMEVNHHKGSDVLVDAIEKIIINRRLSKDTTTPPLCQLEVSDAGIKMIDLTHKKRTRKLITDINVESASERLSKLLAFSKETKAISNHFFSLKNVSFCGYHPDSPRYFGFITKHPTERRFACHCYSSVDDSTQEIVDAVGDAFQKYYCGHIPPLSNSSEDFYFE